MINVIVRKTENPHHLCNSINNILHKIPPPALPEFTSVKSLYEHFSKYFVDKIENIRFKFPDKVLNIPSVKKHQIKSKMKVFTCAKAD